MSVGDVLGLRSEAAGATSGETAAATVPQPKRRVGTRVVLPVTLIVAFLLLLGFAGRDVFLPATDVRVVSVVARSGTGGAAASSSVVAQAAGWVEPDSFPIFASALTDGVVEEVLVLEGERVEKGQVLVRMVDDDARLALDRAEAELASREAAVGVARATLEAAQRTWDELVDRKREVAEAAAAVDEGLAALDELHELIAVQDGHIERIADRLRRERAEVEAGAVTEFEVSQTEIELETARNRREALDKRVPVLQARLESARARKTAADRHMELRIEEKQALDEARASLKRAEAERDLARVVRDEAQLRFDRMEVRATIDGVVMQRLAAPGAKIMMGMDSPHSAHVVHLYDPDKLQVRVDVPLADAAGIGVGQRAEVIVEVLPDRVFAGSVTRVVHEADIQKNTLQVKVAIEDPDPELKPEMLARVRLLKMGGESGGGKARIDEIWAPEGLLSERAGERAVAWVVDEGEGVAQRVDVRLGGATRDGWARVTEGLRPGDSVIDARALDLSDGERVDVVGEAEDGSWR